MVAPNSWKWHRIPGKVTKPPKKGLPDPQKSEKRKKEKEKKSENKGPKKKPFPDSIWKWTFCKKPHQNWCNLASAAPFLIYRRL